MVCCDVYERTPDGRLAPEDRGHAVCLYGGWGARIAIEDLDETLEEVLDGFNRGTYPLAGRSIPEGRERTMTNA